jgi:phytanoyl-CoA hydroxylase
MDGIEKGGGAPLAAADVAAYRRDGYCILRGAIGERLVGACAADIAGLASGRIPARSTEIAFEAGVDPALLAPDAREDHIRKFAWYVEDSEPLRAAAMAPRLHRALDQILGEGRVLFQDMALIKPPRIGSPKPWHQDAAYFRVSDPGLIVGVWIALDAARRENGCMEVVPGSHLDGPAVHLPHADMNQCEIRAEHLRLADRVAIELDPGDALIFHALLHHYTAPNRSDLRRRAVQFHYHQTGLRWMSLEDHRRHYHDETGAYAGCTVQSVPTVPGKEFVYKGGRQRPVVAVPGWE